MKRDFSKLDVVFDRLEKGETQKVIAESFGMHRVVLANALTALRKIGVLVPSNSRGHVAVSRDDLAAFREWQASRAAAPSPPSPERKVTG